MKLFGKKSLAAAVMLASVSGSVLADYQSEFGASYQATEIEGVDITALNLGGKFYMDNIKTENLVLKEAAFLNKASYIGLSHTEVEIDEFNYDESALTVEGRYVFEEYGNYYIDGKIVDTDAETVETIAVGRYINDSTDVMIGLENNDIFEDTYFAKFNTVGKVNDNFVGADGGVSVTDGDAAIYLGGDYYFNRLASVGADLGVGFYDETITSAAVNMKTFINDQFSIEAGAGTPDVDEGDVTYMIGLAARF